jgi:hypothetical protein
LRQPGAKPRLGQQPTNLPISAAERRLGHLGSV